MKEVLNTEMAQSEFKELAEDWGMEVETETLDKKELKEYNNLKRPIINALRRGSLTIDEDDNGDKRLNYTLTKPVEGLADLIHFNLPGGVAMLKSQNGSKDNGIDMVFYFLGHIAGLAPKKLAKLKGRDYKFLQAVAGLFLGS